jgi:hypothetical protein
VKYCFTVTDSLNEMTSKPVLDAAVLRIASVL